MSTKSFLVNRVRDEFSKCKDPRMSMEEEFSVGYPTGFLSFDFINGTIIHVKSPEKVFSYYSIGITDGSFVMIIGRSGSGKSTFMVQSAANIIRPFPSACMFVDDIEGGMTTIRREKLTGFYGSDMKQRCIIRNTGITIENFYERIRMIFDLKNQNRGDFSYDTGLYDTYGDRVFKLIPTVYCLDSLALIMSDKYAEEEELSGQMAATATAKSNSSVFKRIIPMLKAANIILFAINHITESVEINMFAKKKAQVSYLKQNERLPGGNTIIYLANNIIRVDDITKLKDEEGLGINGTIAELTLIKSRSNRSGQRCSLVMDYESGFDNDLSLYLMLKEAKIINGAGAYLYIGDRTDLKFSQKNFKQKLAESPEFRELFITTALNVLKAKLTMDEANVTQTYDSGVMNEILNRLNVDAA